LIDEFFVSIRRRIGEERIDFGGSGRQAEHVEVNAADEGAAVGGRIGVEFFGFECGEDEAVDVGFGPRGVLHLRDRRSMQRKIGPVLAILGGDDHLGARCWLGYF